MCWWYSSCIGALCAEKGQAWRKERKLDFDLCVSLASGCLWCQCWFMRMTVQTCICVHCTHISLLMLHLSSLCVKLTHFMYKLYLHLQGISVNKQICSGIFRILSHSQKLKSLVWHSKKSIEPD